MELERMNKNHFIASGALMGKVFIVGCGEIGRRVAKLWQSRGVGVAALARSEESARDLGRLGIETVPGDLDDPGSLGSMPVRGCIVYYLAPPPEEGEGDPRIAAFLSAIPAGAGPERIVYMSTTGVYGDRRGGWVTEETPPSPTSPRGKRRLAAETALRDWALARGVPVVILRVAGIYGPGRIPVERVRSGAPVPAAEEAPASNRIHAQDVARVCVAAALRGKDGSVYNVSDGNPGTITQYYNAVADLLGVPRPPSIPMEEARRVLGKGILSFLSESKRVDSRKLREELGLELLYPDLSSGLAASLESEG